MQVEVLCREIVDERVDEATMLSDPRRLIGR
jgi:hypothetical protein